MVQRMALFVTLAVLGLSAVVSSCRPASEPGPDSQAPPATAGDVVPTVAGSGRSSEVTGKTEEVPDFLACDAAKLPFPLPEDVRNCRSLDVLTTFQTDLSADDVVAFYGGYLTDNGWAVLAEGVAPGWAAWTNDTTQFDLVAGPGSNGTDVQIKYYARSPGR